jgi:hypothetical protein
MNHPLVDAAYAASVRFIEAMESIDLSVTTAKVVTPEGGEPGVRVGTISSADLEELTRLIVAEAARRALAAPEGVHAS